MSMEELFLQLQGLHIYKAARLLSFQAVYTISNVPDTPTFTETSYHLC